ncbi:MAG: hypothetical protein ACAH80_18605 [Alphaproteobacteria bacterium]
MVSYPLTLPTHLVKSLVIRKANVAGMSVSPYTGSQEVISFPGEWWEADVGFAPAAMLAAGAIEAFIGKLKGPVGTFLMGDPMRPVPFGQAASFPGTPVVDGAHVKGDTVLDIKSGPLSKAGWLLAGDYVQLGTSTNTRLHQVMDDANTDGAGKTSVNIWPALRYDLSDNDTVVITACKGIFRIPQAKLAITRRPGPKTDFSFTAIEAL